MSESTRNKMRKKREPSENLVKDFIDKHEFGNQQAAKKLKKASSAGEKEEDPDESLKLFKSIKPKAVKIDSVQQPSTSNAATNFIDTTSQKPKPRAKKATKPSKRKPKASADIRKVFGKQEEMFNQVVSENCLQEGLDPDEMQLALAISESLKDQQQSEAGSSKFENPFTSMGKVQPIGAALEKFGFKCKKTYSEYELDMISNAKLTKRSKFQKFPTALTRTSNDKRNEIIGIKIDRVLGMNRTVDFEEVESSNHHHKVASFYLQEMEEKSRTAFKINCDDRPTENVLLDYYVTELFEPSFLRADHLLKDWSKIPGREPSPDRVAHKGTEEQIQQESDDVDQITTNHLEQKKLSSMTDSYPISFDVPTEEYTENIIDNDSCVDIFADLEDECESFQENSEKLADQLELLHDKLSQSIMVAEEVEEIKSGDSDATIENYLSESANKDLLKEQTTEISNKSESFQVEEEDVIDLTQHETPPETSIPIPFDDSFYSLQQHLKNLGELEQSSHVASAASTSSVRQKEDGHQNLEKQEVSFTQVDLVSTDDEFSKSTDEVHDKSGKSLPVDEPMNCSQNSTEDDSEIIDISDEEVNYSMRKFHKNDTSIEDEAEEGDAIDLTQTDEIPEAFEQFEIDNIVEQSLVEIMQQEDFNINNSVVNLLETSFHSSTVSSPMSFPKKDSAHSGLSESIKEIMSRYRVNIEEKKNSPSFRKMQSDSSLTSSFAKRRKTVEFSLEDDDNIVDLTQQIKDDDLAGKENLYLNCSIHKSLESILENSPVRPLKQVRSQTNLKRKSLGVDVDNDYIVDTDSVVAEPEFKNMTPVELKQALFKFGVRPLPVKKAVSLLEYIYDQLHPKIRVAADEEIDVNDSRRDMNITDIATNIGAQEDDNFVFQVGLVDDEVFVLPTSRKSKIPTCAIPLHISFYNMVRSNVKIQNYILEFRPIELDQVHKHFRKFGLTYQPNDIIAFLDKRCITFKTKEKSYSKTHERKKQKLSQKSQQTKTKKKT